MLLVYLFGSSSIFSLHSHNDHDHDHNHDVLFCDKLHQASSYDSVCSHDSHITSLKESCDICDHFANCEPVILDSKIKSNIELFSKKSVPLFVFLCLDDSINTLNKSPPFIIETFSLAIS